MIKILHFKPQILTFRRRWRWIIYLMAGYPSRSTAGETLLKRGAPVTITGVARPNNRLQNLHTKRKIALRPGDWNNLQPDKTIWQPSVAQVIRIPILRIYRLKNGGNTQQTCYAEYIEAFTIISTKSKQAKLAIVSIPLRCTALLGTTNADQIDIEIGVLNAIHQENLTSTGWSLFGGQ